ncbi:MAG: hypothetical protein ABWZ98_00525 [Nakamurella sp.]
MRLLVATLLVIPRAAMIVWATVATDSFMATFRQSWILALLFFLVLPYAGLVLLMTASGGMDLVDWSMVGLAIISDILTYSTWRYDANYRRSTNSTGSVKTADAEMDAVEVGPTPKVGGGERYLAAPQPGQLTPLSMRGRLARYLPWPGMRLNSALKYWCSYADLAPEDQQRLQDTAYRSTKSSVLASSHLWIAFLLILAYANNAGISWDWMVVIAVAGPVITISVILAVGHLNADFRIVLPLVELLAAIERLPSWPAGARQIRSLNGDIEKIAEAIQKLPLRLGSNRQEVIEAGAAKASAMRNLQTVVSFGASEGKDVLKSTLTDGLVKVLRGRWVDLPGGATTAENLGLTALQKSLFVLLAIAFGGVATWVGFNSSSWGAGSGLVISILVTLSIGCLIRSGVAPGGLQQAIDASKGLKG